MIISSIAEFEVWLDKAAPKDRCVYNIGEHVRSGRLNDRVRVAYNSGLVTLTQIRLDHGRGKENLGSQWEFIAIRLANVVKPRALLPLDTLA